MDAFHVTPIRLSVLYVLPHGSSLPGASVRNSAHGKGHEEGGLAYAKAGSSLRSPPGNPRADRKSTRLNSSHSGQSRMPSSA